MKLKLPENIKSISYKTSKVEITVTKEKVTIFKSRMVVLLILLLTHQYCIDLLVGLVNN